MMSGHEGPCYGGHPLLREYRAVRRPGFGAAPGSLPVSNPSAGRTVQHVRVHAMAGMRWS